MVRRTIDTAKSGFALIIAIVLMAFILLLLVSLSTLVTVETATVQNDAELSQARSNALLAMQIALGQLQEEVGPDQRVTARADILEPSDGSSVAAHPYWTGVWDTTVPGQAPRWLVSDSENVDSEVSLGKDESVQLVGLGSIFDVNGNSEADDEEGAVSAAVVEMTDDSGGYAYWIGDENVKSKINLVDNVPGLDSDELERLRNALGLANQEELERLRLAVPKTTGLSILGEDGILASLENSEELERVVDISDLQNIDGNQTDDVENFLKQSFHDLTTYSFSTLTDVRRGGLKKNLTALMEVDADDWPAAYRNEPIVDLDEIRSQLASVTSSNESLQAEVTALSNDPLVEDIKTFEYLKSYYDLHDDVITKGGITPRLGGPNEQPISPLIEFFSLGMAGGLTSDNFMSVDIFPQVVLHNPYNVTLKAKDYYVLFYANGVHRVEVPQTGREAQYNISYTTTPVARTGLRYKGDLNPDEPASATAHLYRSQVFSTIKQNLDDPDKGWSNGVGVNGNIYGAPRFLLKCPDMLPGEALFFSLPSSSSLEYDREEQEKSSDHVLLNVNTSNPIRWPSGVMLQNLPNALSAQWTLPDGVTGAFSKGAFFDLALAEAVPDISDYYESITGGSAPGDDFRVIAREAMQIKKLDGSINTTPYVYQHTGRIYVDLGDVSPSVTTINNNTHLQQHAQPFIAPVPEISIQGLRYQVSGADDSFQYRPFLDYNPRARDLDPPEELTDRSDIPQNPFFTGYVGSADLPILDTYGSGDEKVAMQDGVNTLVLYDIPQSPAGLFSIGQLQHLMLSERFNAHNYVVGNSNAHPDIPLDSIYEQGNGAVGGVLNFDNGILSDDGVPLIGKIDYSLIDMPYLYNEALWDRFFFSATGSINENIWTFSDPLPNARYIPYLENEDGVKIDSVASFLKEIEDIDSAASRLLVDGGFNVNSTSVEAWKSILSGLTGVNIVPSDLKQDNNKLLQNSILRLIQPVGGSNDDWSGYRELTDKQLDALAQAIVIEVKKRGPFRSLSEFVNRRVDNSILGESGALQAAIDSTDINDSSPGISVKKIDTLEDHQLGGKTGDGSIGYLTQADILQAIGPIINVRSDSFIIRAYGNSKEQSSDIVKGEAWCEAVVQRTPHAVLDSAGEALTVGRMFKIVSFRWLNKDEV